MDKVIRYYLFILPFFSLGGIILGVFRTAYQDSFVLEYLLLGAILDFIVFLFGWKKIWNRTMLLIILLLLASFMIGMFNFNVDRRFITDFSNPFFFFSKVFIFRYYWKYSDFSAYTKYYYRIAFFGSILLLPVTYFIFSTTSSTRLAIFPPMELPFSYLLVYSGVGLIIGLLIILLYGKRAQLVGAILTMLIFIFVFKKRQQLFKYVLLMIVSFFVIGVLFTQFSDNLAIKRLTYSLGLLEESNNNQALNRLSAGRFDEVDSILREMETIDYFIGKGFGFTYSISVDLNSEDKEASNAHFSPLGFLSKYGIIFTFFIYFFFISVFFKTKKHFLNNKNYVIALTTTFFVFIESFFSYAIFTTPILPVIIGYLKYSQEKV